MRSISYSIKHQFVILFLPVIVLALCTGLLTGAAKKPMTFADMMRFNAIQNVQISDNGMILAYTLKPDRGDPAVISQNTGQNISHRIDRGEKPVVSPNGKWVAASLLAGYLELEKDKKKEIKPGMVLLETETDDRFESKRVKRFEFSKNSRWLIYQHHPAPEEKAGKKELLDADDKKKETKKYEKELHTFVLRHLPEGKELSFNSTGSFALDPEGRFVAVEMIAQGDRREASLVVFGLGNGHEPRKITIQTRVGFVVSKLAWSKKKSRLAFLWTSDPGEKNEGSLPVNELWLWDGMKGGNPVEVGIEEVPAGWMIPPESGLQWADIQSEDLLYVGLKPVNDFLFYKEGTTSAEANNETGGSDGFNIEKLQKESAVDVWHWQDPVIKPQEKKDWKKNKEKTFWAVYHLHRRKLVPLADRVVTDVAPSLNKRVALGSTREPYLVESTWSESFKDYYLVNLDTGQRKKLLTRHHGAAKLSPQGKYLLYFSEGDWFLRDLANDRERNLTGLIGISFSDEDHDYPSPAPSYEVAGWLEGDRGVMICDKYDIWRFQTDSGKFKCLTGSVGCKNKTAFRVIATDPQQKFFSSREDLLLRAHSHLKKTTHFYRLNPVDEKLVPLVSGEKKYSFIKKAEAADIYLFTRESFAEFPDIWLTDWSFGSTRKLTDANPQMKNYLWGSAELVEWNSADGEPLQGVLMKPENFDSNKRYPVLVYYYRLFSHRLHEYNRPAINHRPCFPFYTGHDYVVFLPDIRFKVGTPGFSATKCLVPGVQKLIDLGVADPECIALHGHSWSGYQTAFVITQTNMFAAAIAGAPVSNMTSAYGGIRWGTGLARQFQYEVNQSRIGGSLWQYPERYIENSPIFFADRINTPLLIMHGDADDAVPWYQSIEMYLAMRRLGKDCIFLQYNEEPHHLKKYPNKLDYAIKMKEYLDHYLKGTPAPGWIKIGVNYKKN